MQKKLRLNYARFADVAFVGFTLIRGNQHLNVAAGTVDHQLLDHLLDVVSEAKQMTGENVVDLNYLGESHARVTAR